MKSSNFREICAGDIAPKTLYRSNHPIFNSGQDKEVVLSANTAKIQTIINLSDDSLSLKNKIINSPWYRKMHQDKKVVTLGISMRFNILEPEFLQKIKQGINFMIKNEPPYLIHCEVGIDRTGFFAFLLESFMKAGIDEMGKDYMLSYVNADEYSDTDQRLGSEFVLNLLTKINGGQVSAEDDFYIIASNYLTKFVGLKKKELSILRDKFK